MKQARRAHDRFDGRSDYLRRLPPAFYRGQAYVHWAMTINRRRTGWLSALVHATLREILTHTAFRYGLCAPLYCCMPDHLHLVWIGIVDESDQRLAARFFRDQFNVPLEKLGVRLQQQGYDHVLREEERGRAASENVIEYVARNPERAGLVAEGRFRDYPYTGCLLPGYPDLSPWQPNYWELFWRIYGRLRTKGLVRASKSPEA